MDMDWYLVGEKNVSATELMIGTLLKLDISTFDELIKHSGRAEALSGLKLYRKANVPHEIEMARKKLGISGNGPDALLSFFLFSQSTVVPSHMAMGEIKENGAVGVSKGCLFCNAPPEFCIFISHYLSDAICEQINPEYECVWTHHLTQGDPYCRFVFKKRSESIYVIDDLGQTLATLPKFEMPKEQFQAVNLWALSIVLSTIISTFIDIHGVEEARKVLGASARKIGIEVGANLLKQNPDLEEDAVSMGKLIQGLQNALGQKDNFIVVSIDEVSNEITDCSQQVSPNGALCEQYESLFKGMLSAINPDYELIYDKMITKGDKTCHWSLKRRSSTTQVENPLKVLKMRFARGEISKEEYLKMRELLEI